MSAPVLVVAATSARMLAESARRGGLRPIALDLFGDLDTRRAAHWIGIARPRRNGFDAERMHSVLTRLAKHPGVLGWVAGGGFEDRLDLLEEGARALALIGNGAAAIAAIKQPAGFFALLDRFGIGHPETRLTPPPSSAGWLRKRIGGTGGWHVRRLQPGPRDSAGAGRTSPDGSAAERSTTGPPPSYFQREAAGIPMSVLFLANGAGASLIGFNRLLFEAAGDRPFVFSGAVGPVGLPAASANAVRRAVAQISAHVGLLGLNSMDFMLADGSVSVLEVNPRPTATVGLHDDRLNAGLMKAHVVACRQRLLPEGEPTRMVPVRGLRVVYARRQSLATRRGRARLQELGWCHDIGRVGTLSERGEPLCSVSAHAGSEDEVIAQLAQRASHIERIEEEENDH